MDMDQVQRKDINNLMNESLSKELDIHFGEYNEENKEYTFNINPFNYATVECNNWIMDFDELSKSYVPTGDSIIFLFNDKVKLSELSLKHISRVVLSFTALGCMVESVGFGSSVIDFVEVNSSGDVSVSLDLSKYSVNELVKLFSDDLFSIVVVLSNNLNESNSVLKDWNIQFTFKDLLLDEKEATKNRIEEFTETTYLKKSDIIDTGWVNATLTNQFNTYAEHTVKYRQIGGVIFITGIVSPKNSISFPNSSTSVKICDLPQNCTPDKELYFLQTISATYKYRLEVKSDGLYISNPSSGSSRVSSISNTAYLSLDCSYCLTDALVGMINTVIESVGDYNTLANKPSLNGQTLIGNTVLDIPSRTSELINDSEYITSSYHDNSKVDKVSGKGLSTVDFTDTNYVHTDNNYTNSEKNKLTALENYDDTDVWVTLQELEENKQNTLIAGSGISIVGNVISVTGTIKPLTELILTSDKLVTSNEVTLTTHLQFIIGESGRGDIANATIQFYKKVEGEADVLIGSSFTDEYGVCSLDTSISENTIFYAYYSGDNDYEPSTSNDLTIEKSSYIYYDACDSSDNIEHYVEASISQRQSIPAHSLMTYDSSKNSYKLVGQSPYFILKEIPELNNLDNYIISADMMVASTSAFNQIGIGIHEEGNQNNTYMYRIRGDSKVQTLIEGMSQESTIYSSSTQNIWFNMKVTKQGTNFNLELSKDGNIVKTYNWTIPTFNNPRCGIIKQTEQSSQTSYVKNIKVESL